MNLSPRALNTPATTAHTFTINNIYTGTSYECTLTRETKCFYIVEVLNGLSGGRSMTRRFHKATMCIDELCLYIAAPVTINETLETLITPESIAAVAEVQADHSNAAPSNNEAVNACPVVASEVSTGADYIPATRAPNFCPNCEQYHPNDEMTHSVLLDGVFCIDCANEINDAYDNGDAQTDAVILELFKSTSQLNYMGGHLAGFNFTPTIDELPAGLVPYQPVSMYHRGSPAHLCELLGYSMLKVTHTGGFRVLYNERGAYVTHGRYNDLNQALIKAAKATLTVDALRNAGLFANLWRNLKHVLFLVV